MPNRIQKKSAANASGATINTTDANDVRSILLESLASVRQDPIADLSSQFSSAGDIKIDSAEAEIMIVTLEEQLGCKMPKPSSLRSEQFTSVNFLTNLAMQKMHGRPNTAPVSKLAKTTA